MATTLSEPPAGAKGTLIAIDWGTTHRRAYLLADDGTAVDRLRDDLGVSTMAADGYAPAIERLRTRWSVRAVIAAGMVGARGGWREVPYVTAPAGLDTVAAGLAEVEADVWIVPGVRSADDAAADVMRGEETTVLGAVAAGLVPPDGTVLKPGTHPKGVMLADGRIAGFATAMTGEVFALLRERSMLATLIDGAAGEGPAFDAGVRAGAGGDLLHQLFAVRAQVLLGRLPAADAPSYASGLLIGTELAGRRLAGTVHLLADPPHNRLYARALGVLGIAVVPVPAEPAFLSGIAALARRRG